MKKVLVTSLAIMLCASGAMADSIGVYSETGGADGNCALTTLVPPPGANTLYIVHKLNEGSTAAQFKVNDLSGLFPANQTTTFLTLGTWNVDLSVSYGGCVSGEIVIMNLIFLWFGTPTTGCNNRLDVVAAPTSPIPGEIATVECDFATVTPAAGLSGYVGPGSGACCPVIATEESTWGGVKALYR